jgi:hypothetical protein
LERHRRTRKQAQIRQEQDAWMLRGDLENVAIVLDQAEVDWR